MGLCSKTRSHRININLYNILYRIQLKKRKGRKGMKVLLLNGSPHTNGCTNAALKEVARALEQQGIDTEIVHIGNEAIHGCMGCGQCVGKGKCVFTEDRLNEVIEKAEKADGYVFGSPVHYAGASGAMTSFMDRLFYAGGAVMKYKPAACVVSARRGGTTTTYDQLNKYIQINNMIMVPSQYWNMVHGSVAEDVEKDEEGMQIMRNLGINMAWLLRLIANGDTAGVERPQAEAKIRTNYIR